MARFVLVQDGVSVAEVEGADRKRCMREIMHYAMVYGQDGPCTIKGLSPEDFAALTRRISSQEE